MSNDRLETYRQKRHPDRTPEPSGDGDRDGGDDQRFVIQQHDASSMHWDVRLEVGGVLRSWAVPKGPSTDPREKRLAVPTEDHPVEYLDFEGLIPEDEYGAGAVIVWDSGEYHDLKADEGEGHSFERDLDEGHATFWLEGHKLQGGYALTRTGSGDDERWLLVKMDDDGADARRNPVSTQPESVLSGRTIEDVWSEAGEDD